MHSDDYYVKEKIVKLLLGIYKQMKEEENLDAMNKMMDFFDEYVIANSYIINDAIEKITYDNSRNVLKQLLKDLNI